MVSGSKDSGQICTRRPCPMDDGLARLITLENVRRVQGSAGSSGGKNVAEVVGLALERLKRLSQILKERARQLEICGFKALREAVVYESQRIPGVLALAVFGEQACQGHR